MATTLRTALFILLFALILQMQYNIDADKTATRQLKNALELAVHDATLAINTDSVVEGKVIFDRDLAIENLKNSLEASLNVKSEGGYVFTPNKDSFFQDDLYLVHLEFIDESASTIFPLNYINPDYEILETINGPSIVAVLTTESPRWFHGKTTFIRQAAVYEYKK